MRVLLDECLPKMLKQEFQKYRVSTVPEMGWAGKTNGELIRLAKEKFDIFITIDQNLQYQQNLKDADMSIILLHVKNNRPETFKPFIPKIKDAFETIGQHQFIHIKT